MELPSTPVSRVRNHSSASIGPAVKAAAAVSDDEQHTAATVHGMSWMALNTVASRAIVFLSQLLLGYLLGPADFGVYALALSVTAALGAVRNGGAAQVMIARGLNYRDSLSPVTQYALIMNAIAMLVLLIVAPVASTAHSNTDIGWLIAAIGLSFPLGTFATTFRTELSIQGRFREVAILNTLSTVLWQIEVIVLAALGFGAYSFAIPMVLQSVIDGLLGCMYVKSWPLRGRLISWRQFVSLFMATRWIMLGLAMLALGLTGQYFAAGLFTDPATVGVFFFGYQLAYTFFVILNNSIEAVLPPMLARLNDQPLRQAQTTLEMLKMLMIISLPMAGAVALSAHVAIHLLWHGRWDRSAQVVSITVLSVPAWVVIAIVRAVLDARGMWTARLGLLSIYGIGTCIVVAAAATTKDIVAISWCLSVFYVIYGAALLGTLAALTSAALSDVVGAVAKPLLVCMACALLAILAALALPTGSFGIVRDLVGTLAFCLAALISNWILFGKTWRSALGIFVGGGQRFA